MAYLRERLNEEAFRLARLTARDRAVRAAFAVSYVHLPSGHRRIFRLLACHPGPDFSALSVGALAGSDVGIVEAILEDLLDESLLEQRNEGRYTFHDLVRLFAAERLQAEDLPAAIDQAKNRVLRWYLRAADAADRVLAPHRRHVLSDAVGVETAIPRFESYEDAFVWCETEQAAIASAVRMAAAQQEHKVAWQLPTAMFGFHRAKHSWREWLDQQCVGLDAARTIGDENGEAWVTNALGITYTLLGQHDEAYRSFVHALGIRRRLGDRVGESQTLNNLGEFYRRTGQLDQAIDCYRQDQLICRELGDGAGECISLNNLGKVQLAIGRTPEALASQREVLQLCRKVGDQHCEAEILDDLGQVYRALGQPGQALKHHYLAVDAYRRIGSEPAAAESLASTAELLNEMGNTPEALQRAQAAIALLGGCANVDTRSLRRRLSRLLEPHSSRSKSA